MKRYSAATLATVALALGVWTFFYVLDPEMPLDSADMFVVVAGCAAVVVVAKWAWKQLPRRNGRSQEP
jgi:uncharacterized membrane protein YccC